MSMTGLVNINVTYLIRNPSLAFYLTLCGTRKLEFFYAEILPEFKNRFMCKIENAIFKKTIKIKISFKISGMNFSS